MSLACINRHNLLDLFRFFHIFSINLELIRLKFYMSFCYDNPLNMHDAVSCKHNQVQLGIIRYELYRKSSNLPPGAYCQF